ncbi:MAG: glycoside hydrolase family 2 [Prevotellaceae bacterium]|jgi:hypothetical protein|nr:glycoside hydrolase family 2 [Prevotellaceae bacterium]
MKFFDTIITSIALSAILMSGCSDKFSTIEKGFVSPPDSVRIGVYWYWINDNISKEAVVKDLQSMKEAGITRAFIGNIGQQSYPTGKVKILSDEWWDVMHTALKTATELGIELGIFNSPGWSQSGGPWITPEQSMRYLDASELRVKGPVKLEQKLSKTSDDFQDVKVIAFPVAGDYKQNLFDTPNARVTFSDSKILAAKSPEVFEKYVIPTGESYIGLILPKTYTARSLELQVSDYSYAEAELQAKTGTEFKSVKRFVINRTNANLNVGFKPYAPIVVTFPDVTSSEYRIVFNNTDGVRLSNIILSATPVMERYPEKTLAKMFQSPLPYWHDYLWDKQPEIQPEASSIAKPEQTLDISKYMAADGTLTWDVPEGEWIILRTGMRSTGVTNSPASVEGTGLEVDKMSKEHVAAHFDAFLGKIIERVPAKDRKTWKLAVQDSYETGGQNFTDGFFEDFKERYGYDALPYLPVFNGHIIGSPDLSDRFLWDVRRMVADKVAYDYVGGLREICHKHGLGTWLENYGHWGFPGEFLQYGGQSDEVGGEFWSEGNLGDIENRAASSCAHIYGKTRVSAESFTCGGGAYVRYPAIIKRRGDWSFTEGINNTLLHVYIQQAYEDRYPGIDEWFGNEFNRKNTWFKHIDLFTLYLRRCNFMLQQGLNVADVAYFIGEDAPKMTGIRNPEIPQGYSFDYINAEVIVRDLSVKDGKLILPHGTSYRVLVLPKLETMRPEVLQKIEQLVSEGAVILGPPPSRSPSMKGYPEADELVNSLAKKMWGDLSVKQRSYGKGTILTGMNMQEVLDLLRIVPDCRIDPKTPLLYNHRTFDGKDIYFITNQSEQQVKTSIDFRIKDMQPELWDAVTGTIRPLPAFEQTDETTIVPVKLESLESVFIVFRKKGSSMSSPMLHNVNFPEMETVVEINSPWEVTFESDAVKRGPTETVVFDKLCDWSKHENEQIRYYSGTAVYKTKCTLAEKPAGKTLYLDLGKVSVMAKVKINGKYVGGVWTTPYRVDVTSQLKNGDNSVEIEVVNTWVNRIIGDLRLPPENRIVYTDKLTDVNTRLQSSGLLGPVSVIKK